MAMIFKTIRWLHTATALLLLSACGSSNVIDIAGRDNEGVYSLQTSMPLSENENPTYLKLRLSSFDVSYSQVVADGEVVDLENVRLAGPDGIAVDSNIGVASLSFGTFDLPICENCEDFSSSFFIGLSRSDFEADVHFYSGQTVRISDIVPEVYFDIGFWYQMTDKNRLGLMLAFGRNSKTGGYSEIQLSWNYMLPSHMELAVGFQGFVYDYNKNGDSGSTLFIESRGPFINLNFPF